MLWRVSLSVVACLVTAGWVWLERGDESKSALESQPSGWSDIMPDKNLKGWTRMPVPADSKLHSDVEIWKVDEKAHLLDCRGQLPADPDPQQRGGSHEFFRYDKELKDFVFHVEFRFVDPDRKGWNSGVFIRNSADGNVWHQAQIGNKSGGYWFGNTPDAAGALHRVTLKATENRVKGVGEWNTFEITAKGSTLRLWINGAFVCDWEDVKVAKGYIGLEAEYHHIAFRNLKLKELH